MIQFLAKVEGAGSGTSSIAQMCGGSDILGAIKFVMLILDILFTLIPIVLIVLLAIDFAKNVIAKDESGMQKNFSLAIKRLIMCLALFLVVPFTHFLINLIGSSGNNFATCISVATTGDISQYSLDSLFDFAKDMQADKKTGNQKQYIPGTTDNGSDSSVGSGDSANNIDDARDEQNDLKNNSSSGSKSTNTSNRQNIFIGDSRIHGMQNVIGDKNGDIWIYKDGAGYEWLAGDAMSKLRNSVVRGKSYNIFINLGVNDLGNQSKYMSQYNNIANSYVSSKVIVVSVNPVDEGLESQHGYSVKNKSIEQFNRVLSYTANNNDKLYYCNTYNKIKSTFRATDGVHYTNDTYKSIYNEMKKCA